MVQKNYELAADYLRKVAVLQNRIFGLMDSIERDTGISIGNAVVDEDYETGKRSVSFLIHGKEDFDGLTEIFQRSKSCVTDESESTRGNQTARYYETWFSPGVGIDTNVTVYSESGEEVPFYEMIERGNNDENS